MQRFLSECEILFMLRHPWIIRIYGFNYGNDEVIQNKELKKEQKCKITVELVLGMRYIHHRIFMHRDLKQSNVLLSKNNNVRISDFGLDKKENSEKTQSNGVGTLCSFLSGNISK